MEEKSHIYAVQQDETETYCRYEHIHKRVPVWIAEPFVRGSDDKPKQHTPHHEWNWRQNFVQAIQDASHGDIFQDADRCVVKKDA